VPPSTPILSIGASPHRRLVVVKWEGTRESSASHRSPAFGQVPRRCRPLASVPQAIPRLAQFSVWWGETARPVLSDPSVLDDEERERWSRYRSAPSAARYFGAHALARYVLGELLHVHPSSLRFDRRCAVCGAQHGKPRITWPESPLDFSISASADRVVLAVSPNTLVGVDLEFSLPPFDVVASARQWLTDAEFTSMAALPSNDRQAWCLQTWTRKEAILKAVGAGLAKDPRRLTIIKRNRYSMRAVWADAESEAPVFVRDLEFADYSAAVAAVALEGMQSEPPLITKLP
jgi:4'-phosphopantetheinyl transferase